MDNNINHENNINQQNNMEQLNNNNNDNNNVVKPKEEVNSKVFTKKYLGNLITSAILWGVIISLMESAISSMTKNEVINDLVKIIGTFVTIFKVYYNPIKETFNKYSMNKQNISNFKRNISILFGILCALEVIFAAGKIIFSLSLFGGSLLSDGSELRNLLIITSIVSVVVSIISNIIIIFYCRNSVNKITDVDNKAVYEKKEKIFFGIYGALLLITLFI